MANARQLEKGKWILQSYKNGKRKTFRGKSRKEVEEQERCWLNELNTYGRELVKESINLSSILYDHLFVNIKASVSLGTFERYMSLYNTHIKDSKIGAKNIKDIVHKDLQKFFNRKDEMSSKSLSMLKYLLGQAFDYAITDNFIRTNPMASVKLPKSKFIKKEIEVFTLQEQNDYIRAAEKSFYSLLFKVSLSTGMRVGEIIALKWINLDLNKMEISVKESSRLVTEYDDKGNSEDKVVTTDPKTKAGIRTIPIHESLNKELKKHKLSTGGKKTDYVFRNTKGNQIKYDSIAKAHKLVCVKAKVRVVTFHCMRHTFATRLIESGSDAKTVSQLLGHTDVKITLNRYVHSTNDTKRNAIENLHKAIGAL